MPMKAAESLGKGVASSCRKAHRSERYRKVFDGRKQPVRGLWERDGRFIARVSVEDSSGAKRTKWVPLGDERNPVITVPQAVAAHRRLLTRRDDDALPVLRRTPKLADYVELYLARVKGRKRPATFVKERGSLGKWVTHMGGSRIDKISRAQVNDYLAKRKAQQFADYIRLMAFCGARRDETLRLRWADVDFERKQLTIGADGLSKNHKPRVIDFNSELESHLSVMGKRKAPDSQWLFPSPQRGEKDIPAKTFKESLDLTRAAAKLPKFTFHDCRHYFISQCVMSGIDFMTIARWVGHQDGGVLIGKVYGDVANEHRQLMAQRVVFRPMVVPPGTEAVA